MDDHVATWAKRLRRAPLLPSGEGLPVGTVDLGRVLPHRAPMLLLDRIEAVDPSGARIRVRRRIDPADPVFGGHFPARPIYPGVLLVEAMAQAALATMPFVRSASAAVPTDYASPSPRFTRVREAAFFAAVLPGDEILVHAQAIDDGLLLSALGQVYRGDTLCAIAVSEAYLDD